MVMLASGCAAPPASQSVQPVQPAPQNLLIERITAKVPFPRGLEWIDGQLYVLARGRVRESGGVSADIDDLAQGCRFGDCAHGSEPGCAVRAALDDGRLDAARWHNYQKLRDELAVAADTLESRLRRKGEERVLTRALGRRLDEKYGRH